MAVARRCRFSEAAALPLLASTCTQHCGFTVASLCCRAKRWRYLSVRGRRQKGIALFVGGGRCLFVGGGLPPPTLDLRSRSHLVCSALRTGLTPHATLGSRPTTRRAAAANRRGRRGRGRRRRGSGRRGRRGLRRREDSGCRGRARRGGGGGGAVPADGGAEPAAACPDLRRSEAAEAAACGHLAGMPPCQEERGTLADAMAVTCVCLELRLSSRGPEHKVAQQQQVAVALLKRSWHNNKQHAHVASHTHTQTSNHGSHAQVSADCKWFTYYDNLFWTTTRCPFVLDGYIRSPLVSGGCNTCGPHLSGSAAGAWRVPKPATGGGRRLCPLPCPPPCNAKGNRCICQSMRARPPCSAAHAVAASLCKGTCAPPGSDCPPPCERQGGGRRATGCGALSAALQSERRRFQSEGAPPFLFPRGARRSQS